MRLWHQRSGISSVEYALLLALIGSGIVVAANALSESVADQMDRAAECLDGTNPDCTT
ncbi:MAG: Flp family type IVb pilin [Alphaproteobacteria bacterium]|nr:MAG: Flp family type IVb pilin [Alphaproteobacteria bacterium]